MFKNFNSERKVIIDVKKRNLLDLVKSKVYEICKTVSKKKLDIDFNFIHKKISISKLNDFRLKVFEELNKENLHQLLYQICEDEINFLCSRDLAVQKRINIGFHLPNDKSSIINLHSDTLSGQSPFEIVQWIPLCDVESSNSMYFFNSKKSEKINRNLGKYEQRGFSKILKDYLKKEDYLKLNYGQILLFSPTNWHGNSVNKTSRSRVSINLRYKPLFSPKHDFISSEKGMGTFYKLLNMSEASKIGMKYKLPLNE